MIRRRTGRLGIPQSAGGGDGTNGCMITLTRRRIILEFVGRDWSGRKRRMLSIIEPGTTNVLCSAPPLIGDFLDNGLFFAYESVRLIGSAFDTLLVYSSYVLDIIDDDEINRKNIVPAS